MVETEYSDSQSDFPSPISRVLREPRILILVSCQVAPYHPSQWDKYLGGFCIIMYFISL